MENQAKMQAVKNIVLVHGAFADGSGYKGVYENLTKQGFQVILAGHSWGGAVITQAGNHPNVAGLVYIAAFQPDNGESALHWFQTAQPAAENGVLPPDEKGIVYYDKASQGAFYAKCFVSQITDAAWRSKPTYGIVATEDKSILPEIQQNMYKRSNTKVTEIKGSPAVYISQPEKIAAVISGAAREVASH